MTFYSTCTSINLTTGITKSILILVAININFPIPCNCWLSIFLQFHLKMSLLLTVVQAVIHWLCLCLCALTSSNTLEQNCQKKPSQVTVYPVELFHILISQMNGTAPGVVHSSLKSDNTASLSHLQETINVDCALLKNIIFTTDSLATFILQVSSFKILKQHSLYFLSVFTTICPQLNPENVTVLPF